METSWNACIALAVIYILYCIRLRIKKLQIFKNANIPGPPPSFFIGNSWDIYKNGTIVMAKRWHEQYGPVVGYFAGMSPVVTISDTELLKKIMIKDFHKFADRPRIITGEDILTIHDTLIALKGQRWKDVRSTLTPAFTSKKLKKVAPEMCKSVDKFMNNVDRDFKYSMDCNIYELYQALTLDTICRSGMGFDCRAQDEVGNSKLMKQLEVLFGYPLNIGLVIFGSFPSLQKLLGKFAMNVFYRYHNHGEDPQIAVMGRCAEVVKMRRLNPELARSDLLQLMMDARLDETPMSIDGDVSEASGTEKIEPVSEKAAIAADDPFAKKPKGLSDSEVIHNAFAVLLAGYETTSSSLAFITKMLLRFPEVQEKVRAELLEATDNGKVFEFDRVQRCIYTEAVIQETLRMYPPVHFFVGRAPAEDVKYGSITIPKGVSVFSSVNEVQHDEKVFPNAKEFRPERFLPENKTPAMNLSNQPFGIGPRICIGMRFAQMEIKLALAKLLTKYRISSKDEPLGEPLIATTILPLIQRVKGPLRCSLELLPMKSNVH